MEEADLRCVTAAIFAYFQNTEPALSAGLSEIKAAIDFPEAVQSARRQFGLALNERQALLMIAVMRGELWWPFARATNQPLEEADVQRVVAALGGFFEDTDPALSLALYDVVVAITQPEIIQQARLRLGLELTDRQVLLLLGVLRGDPWRSFTPHAAYIPHMDHSEATQSPDPVVWPTQSLN